MTHAPGGGSLLAGGREKAAVHDGEHYLITLTDCFTQIEGKLRLLMESAAPEKLERQTGQR